MKDNKIIINDRRKVYIFEIHMMLTQEDTWRVRQQLKKQIQEGCVLLTPGISLISATK